MENPGYRQICWVLLTLVWAGLAQADEPASVADNTVFFENPAEIYGNATVEFEVTRDGDPVGYQTIRFSRAESSLTVDIDAELAVKYLGVTVYRYRYQSTETWRNNRLQSVASTITDNYSKPRHFEATVEGDLMRISDNGKERTAPRVYFASNHWHPDVLTARRLFHTTHGKVYNVQVEDLGIEQIELPATRGLSQTVSARRFRYKARFKADVWYDTRQRWVRLEFPADDGSRIVYSCRNCPPD